MTGNGAAKARVLDPAEQIAADAAASQYGVSARFHPDDFIFWYIYDKPENVDKNDAVREYLSSGRSAVELCKTLLSEARVADFLDYRGNADRHLSFLDFASGYGRVTRHFQAVMPGVEVVACDIHRQAVDFLQSIGQAAEQSAHLPEKLALSRKFDVIFALSFFTHMPRRTFARWLAVLADQLTPRGLLIFTTHGEVSQGLMGVGTLDEDGFFFHPASEQKDLEGEEYGNCVTTFEFVHGQLTAAGLKILQYRQAGAGHHDVYIVYKADPHARGEARSLPARPREVLALERQVAQLKASTSWKITEPLRRATTAFRAMTGNRR